MKLLLDTCVWGGACASLRDAGFDVVWSGDWREDPGDEEILAHAFREGRILITIDKDFGELAVVRGARHRGIVRLVNLSATQQAAACLAAVRRYEVELANGAIITVERHRVRVRPGAEP